MHIGLSTRLVITKFEGNKFYSILSQSGFAQPTISYWLLPTLLIGCSRHIVRIVLYISYKAPRNSFVLVQDYGLENKIARNIPQTVNMKHFCNFVVLKIVKQTLQKRYKIKFISSFEYITFQ